jgi:hypothetical protein
MTQGHVFISKSTTHTHTHTRAHVHAPIQSCVHVHARAHTHIQITAAHLSFVQISKGVIQFLFVCPPVANF